MTSTAKKILEDAFLLPEDERRHLAVCLLESVPSESSDAVADAWDAVVLERLQAAECGEVDTRDWHAVRAELRSIYSRA